MVEVMSALGVLAIGAAGVLALQKATLLGSVNARNLAIANAIATTWAERLRVDALRWNDPGGVPDLTSDTTWLRLSALETVEFPARVVPEESSQQEGAPAADMTGADFYATTPGQPAFCTHLRFQPFTDLTGAPIWTTLLRAEIRVFWDRSGNPITDCATLDPADVDNAPGQYGAVYLATSVRRNTSEL